MINKHVMNRVRKVGYIRGVQCSRSSRCSHFTRATHLPIVLLPLYTTWCAAPRAYRYVCVCTCAYVVMYTHTHYMLYSMTVK